MNKCRSCDVEIPDDQTICYDCAKKFADATEKMWKECAEELKKEYIFDLKKRITETTYELQKLEEEIKRME